MLFVLSVLMFPFLSAWYFADPQGRATQLRNFGPLFSIIITLVVFGIFVYAFGSVYRILGVRQLFLRRSRREIDLNIKERLLDPYLHHDLKQRTTCEWIIASSMSFTTSSTTRSL